MFIAETVCWIGLAISPPRREGKEVITFESEATIWGTNAAVVGAAQGMVATADTVERALALDLSSIPQVDWVLTQSDADVLKVWIGLVDISSAIRYQIYEKELAAIDAFSSTNFAFNLISIRGRSIGDIMSESAHLAFKRQ